MKTKFFFFIIVTSIALFFCSSTQNESSTIITGKVNVNWSNTLKLRNAPVSLTDSWIDRKDSRDSIINLDDDGIFKIELDLNSPTFFTISHESNKLELFITPGDSLNVDFNSEEVFTGSRSALNTHLKYLHDKIDFNQNYIVQNETEFFSQSSPHFNAVIDSMKLDYINTHKQFVKDNKVSQIFEQRVLSDILYRTKFYKIAHPSLYSLYTDEKLPLSPTYYEEIAEGSFDNPELLKSENYVLFLNRYVQIQSAGEHKYENYFDIPKEKIHPRYSQIKLLESHQDIKDYLFTEHLNKSMDNYGITYLEDLMPRFKIDCKDPDLKKQVESRFSECQERREESDTIKIYKRIGDIELEAHIFYPENFEEGDQRSAYLFFHGGGWSTGIPEWGYNNCKNYSSKGMVAISFEYRLVDIHKTNVVDCVRDAKSAILWTRKHAKSLGIDPNKIVAAGFSAGAHLAACTAILNEYEEIDNSVLSSKPNAIVIHSASYNTLKNRWFKIQSDNKPESISTFHNLNKNLVPSIFFHGTEDHLAPLSEFTEFKDKMDALDNDYEYKIFENVGHFFNNPSARKTVVEMTESFLVKNGFIAND